MKKIIILLILIFSNSNYSQTNFNWARQIRGINEDYDDYANSFDLDSNGNTYITGNTMSPEFDIDPTVSGTEIINNTTIQNFEGTYLIKLDSDGNYLWGKTFGTYKRGDQSHKIRIGSDGYIYLLLTIQNLNSSINQIEAKIIIYKINPLGDILDEFSLNIPQMGNINAHTFDLDNQNNFFLTGYYSGNININNTLNFNSNNTGYFLLKIKNNGIFEWIEHEDFITLDTKVSVSPDQNIIFLIRGDGINKIKKINNIDGNIIWERTFLNQHLENFTINTNNEILIVGKKFNYYDTNIDIDPSSNTYFVNSESYIIILDSGGLYNSCLEFNYGVNSYLMLKTINCDDNNYYITGNLSNSIDLDLSSSQFILSSASLNENSFVLKLDSNKNFINAFLIGSEVPQQNVFNNCYSINIKETKTINENLLFIGDFAWTCDFDPSINSFYTLSTMNIVTINDDGYIVKLGNCDTTPPIGDSNQYFCSNQNPTISDLTPNSGIIKWYISSTSTVQLPSSTLLVDGTTYFAEKQTGSCAPSISRLEVTVHINQSPIAPQATNQVFCESENAKISDLIVNGQNIKWYDSLISSTPLTNNTFLANNTNYYASQTSNNCESDRVVITVTITSVNPPTLTSPQTFCFQDNATINNIAITGQNITWYDAQTGGTVLTSTTALQNGVTYYATQTINNCESDRTPILVTIQNTPSPTGSATQTFCSTQNASLNDISINGTNIIWYTDNTSTTALSNSTVLLDNTSYFATQIVNSCESPTRFEVLIDLINTLNALDYQETICDDLDDGFEIINLASFNSNLITTTGNTFSYYTSLNGAENQISSAQINNVSNYNLNIGTTTIFVRIDSQNGCHQVVELKLTLVSKPRIAISDIMPICEVTSITINAGNGFDSYNWSTGVTTQSILISQAGNYSVTVTENHNGISCSSTKNFTVVNSNAATVSEIITSDWTDNNNTITVLISNSSVGNYVYSLDGINYQNSNVFYGLESGEHTVFVKDTNGCGISSEEIYLLMYPKYFTPNGDSYNDTWKIKFSQKEPNLKVAIFDRYGKLLKIMNSYDAWDGKLNGKDLPSDDYWFVVTRQNGKEFRGHFAMKR